MKPIRTENDLYDVLDSRQSVEVGMWPDIEFLDIYLFLIWTLRKYNDQSLKENKSLEAWSNLKPEKDLSTKSSHESKSCFVKTQLKGNKDEVSEKNQKYEKM